MTDNRYRTHHCNELTLEHVNQKSKLAGWIHRKRDHGGLLFLDLRDTFGITQLVITTTSPLFETADQLSLESVISVTGLVVARSEQTINANLPTGHIELQVEDLEICSRAETLPMPVNQDSGYPEEIRLRYRFLDLRRQEMQKNIRLRSQIITSMRRRMVDQGFTEFQTPILTASSPEGARDFLVPSRLHPGKFYALPQAPQQFKQLLMIAGFDRYFQIAPCFRDEDARADRSPGEFYQLDMEMSFVSQEDVFAALEPVLHGVFTEFADGRSVTEPPFPKIRYKDALQQFGSDKPDLRNPLRICDVTDSFKASSFKIFASMIEKGAVIRAIGVPHGGVQPRSFFDKMNSWAQTQGQAGLGYIYWRDDEATGPIARNLDDARLQSIKETAQLTHKDDAIFFICDFPDKIATFAGQARTKLAEELHLIAADTFEFCWIVDYPMFEQDPETQQIDFSHNPFSMPQGGMQALEEQNPLDILAYQYDIVCNGIELSSGAIRNHLPEIMYKAFGIAGYSKEDVDNRFGGMINALKYGAPPHGGSAPGIDRIVMLLAGEQNIREVTAFPMNQMAEDLMMGAPEKVDAHHLKELYLQHLPLPLDETT